MRFWIVLFILTSMMPGTRARADSPKEFALKRLEAAKMRPSFMKKLLRMKPAADSQKWIELSVLGFLKKSDYGAHYSDAAIRSTVQFIEKNLRMLKVAEKRSGVPKEVIASLMWVETKHGRYTGDVPIVQAYLALAGADHPEHLQQTFKALQKELDGDDDHYRDGMIKVVDRSMNKAKWAVEQLMALEKMQRKGINVFKLRGSFAGAFGLGQFIPTSYLKWAVSARKGKNPDLFRESDAILSVGNFLKQHGWGNEERDRKAALFEYNRTAPYGEVILKIADAVKLARSSRSPSEGPSRKGRKAATNEAPPRAERPSRSNGAAFEAASGSA